MAAKPNEVKTVDLGAVANGWPFASNQFVGTVQYTESTSVTIVNMCGSMVVSFRDQPEGGFLSFDAGVITFAPTYANAIKTTD
jgi:hypothetical protein